MYAVIEQLSEDASTDNYLVVYLRFLYQTIV